MEDRIVQLMKLDKELMTKFTETELDEFLSILKSSDSDAKRVERFSKLVKGEDNETSIN